MKTLAESIFGNNIKNSVNTTDLKTAADLIAQNIESKIKLKSEWINGSAKDPDIWENGWYLCRVNPDDFTEVIYLQYTEDVVGSYDNITTAIRLQFNLEKDFDEDDLYISLLAVDSFENFNQLCGYEWHDPKSLERSTNIKDAHCTTNFEGVLNYITDVFWKFKQLVGQGKGFEPIKKNTVEHYFAKNRKKKEYFEDAATKELSRLSRTIIK